MAEALGLFVGACIIAAALLWAARGIAGELMLTREESARARSAQLLQTFAPALAAAQADPRALLTWQPLAATARRLLPDDFAALDRAAGRTFPFTDDDIESAHARWTAEWLSWERAHDAEFKLKALAAEHDVAASSGSPLLRAKVDAVEREKLDMYQRRYEEYVRIAKALQALTPALPSRAHPLISRVAPFAWRPHCLCLRGMWRFCMRKTLAGLLVALLLVPAAAQAEDWSTGRLVKVLIGGGAVAVGAAVAAKSSETTTTSTVIGTSESSTFSKSQLITGLAVAGTGGIILWDGLRSHSTSPSTQIGVSAGVKSRGVFLRRVW